MGGNENEALKTSGHCKSESHAFPPPCFGLLVTSGLGFQSQGGCLACGIKKVTIRRKVLLNIGENSAVGTTLFEKLNKLLCRLGLKKNMTDKILEKSLLSV